MRSLALYSAITLFGVSAAIAQDSVNDHVRSLISDRARENRILVGAIQTVGLAGGGSTEFFFDIDPAKSYTVYGACDDACSDVDLEAHDENEDFVGLDSEEDDRPLIYVAPGASGEELHVVIDLVDCAAARCVVGVGVYEIVD